MELRSGKTVSSTIKPKKKDVNKKKWKKRLQAIIRESLIKGINIKIY